VETIKEKVSDSSKTHDNWLEGFPTKKVADILLDSLLNQVFRWLEIEVNIGDA